MEFRTVQILTVLLGAGVSFVDFRVKLKLLPTVAIRAMKAIIASIVIFYNLFLRVPRPTLMCLVHVQVRLAPKILPVVRVHTNLPLVLLLLVRAPRRLKMKHVKVRITIIPLN